VSTAAAIVVATVALACPLHVLCRVRQGRRACAPAADDAGSAVPERQRHLAERLESLARRASAP
jgi:hypothetical protein